MMTLTLLSLGALSGSPAYAAAPSNCLPYEICGDNIDNDCDGKINEGCGGGGSPGGGGGGMGGLGNITPIGPGPGDIYPIPPMLIDAGGLGNGGRPTVFIASADAYGGAGATCAVDLGGGLPTSETSFERLCSSQGVAAIYGDRSHDTGVGAAFASCDLDGDGDNEWFAGAPLNDAYEGAETGAVYAMGAAAGSYNMPDDASATTYGFSEGAMVGWAMQTWSDSRGREGLAVAAPNESWVADNGGAVYLFAQGSGGEESVYEADGAVFGENSEDRLGVALAAADLNGDGVEDLAMGAPGADTYAEDAGSVYIVTDTSAWAWVSDASFELYGVYAGGLAGASVAAAGDVNGDGLEDLIVGAPGAGGTYGVAHVVYGDSAISEGGSDDLYSAGTMLIGQRGDEAGHSVSGGGDVDGDGRADVWVGAPGHDSDAGAAYLVLGASMGDRYVYLSGADAQLTGSRTDRYGTLVQGADDLNGDGLEDLLVFAPGKLDASGDAGMLLWEQSWTSTSASSSGR